MHTLRIIADEVRTTIKQTFDDKDVSRAQVAFWLIIVGNNLLGKHIEKRSSGAHINVYYPVPVLGDKGRKFIELPSQIFDYNQDSGIEFMAYYNHDEECLPEYQRQKFTRTTPSELQWLRDDKHTKPSVRNPYFWREGDKIHLVGIERAPVKEVEIGIYQTIKSLTEIDIDEPFRFPEELLETLKRQVTDLARYSFLFPQDNKNDGSDTATDPQSKAIPKIQSVNQNNDQQQ